MDTYWMINCSEDGDVYVQRYTRAELEAEIAEHIEDTGKPIAFFNSVPASIDPQYWNGQALLIKGDIVTPQPKQVITKYEVP